MDVNVFLFNDFETLDIFGPIEILGRISEYHIKYYSEVGGVVRSAQGAEVITRPLAEAAANAIFMIPGGMGTRVLVTSAASLQLIKQAVDASLFCLSICTGSAVLARCGVLDGRRATSNKMAMEWVKSNGKEVLWADRARWCVDGKFFTASGVSAGIDMALGFVAEQFGQDEARDIANRIEYIWNEDKDNDPFARK